MLIDLTLRTALVAAVIVATKKYGVWESPEESQELYNTAVTRIQPFAREACDYLNIHVPDLPPVREKTFIGVYYYNQAVKTFVEFLTIFPTYTQVVIEKLPNIVGKYSQEIRDKYDNYQKDRVHKKEIDLSKQIIDDKQLVQPFKPQPKENGKPQPKEKCKCKRSKEGTPGLLPKDAPPSPYKDKCTRSSTAKIPCPNAEVRCKCPKCAKKEGCVVKTKCKKCMQREANLKKQAAADPKPIH